NLPTHGVGIERAAGPAAPRVRGGEEELRHNLPACAAGCRGGAEQGLFLAHSGPSAPSPSWARVVPALRATMRPVSAGSRLRVPAEGRGLIPKLLTVFCRTPVK